MVFAPWLLMAALQAPAAPQAPPAPPATAPTKAEQEIISLSKQKWDWMSERKAELLADLFHEDALFVHMGGTMSKSRELDVIKSGMIITRRWISRTCR